MERELRELIVRGIEAVERLAEDPTIQVETLPPVCPHCEKINPFVRVKESEATGELGEFVIQAECQHCKKTFYAMPVQYEISRKPDEALERLNERKAQSGYNR